MRKIKLMFVLNLIFKMTISNAAPLETDETEFVTCDKSNGFEFKTCGPREPSTCTKESVDNGTTGCVSGCFCHPNLVLDEKTNTCLPRQLCPKSCPEGMIFDVCGPKFVPTCRNPYAVRDTRRCMPDCYCAPRLVFSENSKRCIIPHFCNFDCPQGKVFDKCGPACPPTCRYPKPPKDCMAACVPGCYCPSDQVFSSSMKKCVKLDKCPKPCSAGMVRSTCTPTCLPSCDDPKPTGDCLNACKIGCVCKPGLVMHTPTNTCVPITKCSKIDARMHRKCPERSVYQRFRPSCPPTCEIPQPRGNCLAIHVPGCMCNPGLVFHSPTRSCVPVELCYKSCPDGMMYTDCGGSCLPTCNEPNIEGPCTRECIGRCVCRKGLLYNPDTNSCVPHELCPRSCPERMAFKECGGSCFRTCNYRNQETDECNRNHCKPGCACEGQLLWNSVSRKCVEEIDCPQMCPDNMIFDNCVVNDCLATCDDPNPQCNSNNSCSSNCTCKKGFVFNKAAKQCTPLEDCPTSRSGCPSGMVFRSCDQLCYSTCDSKEPKCENSSMCTRGACVCSEELVYDPKTDSCVDRKHCITSCQDGMVFQSCTPACIPTCDNPAPDCPKPKECLPNCVCKEDLLFDNATGKCVLKSECSAAKVKCPSGMEFRPCNQLCYRTCYSAILKCEIYPECTHGACVCSEKHVYDAKKDACVKREDCPRICPTGMVFNSCAPACLPTCDNYAPKCNFEPCRPRCVCQKGTIFQHELRQCVPENECPRVQNRCPFGTVFRRCDQLCYRTCESPVFKCESVPFCTHGGCVCSEELVYDSKSKTCVEENQCPRACPKDMVFDSCAPACLATCDDPNPVCFEPCSPNCICQKGHIFNKASDQCVPKEECPQTKKGCPMGMVFRPCDQLCYRTCNSERNLTCEVSALCTQGACVCSDSLFYDAQVNSCVERENCSRECQDGMVFDRCAPPCLATCDDPTPDCHKPCSPNCVCSNGSVFDQQHKKCVPLESCPRNCSEGMIFKTCSPACLPTCTNPNPTCSEACSPNCTCKDDFLYHGQTDSCVPKDDCPKPQFTICPSEKMFVSCDKACYATCESPTILCHNSSNCTSGICICNKGLLLNSETNTCVSQEKCPQKPECPSGMIFNDCAPACLPTCENPAPTCPDACFPNCTCPSGFLFNDKNDSCVPKDQCPKQNVIICRSEMIFVSCDKACYATCESPTILCHNSSNCTSGICICNEKLLLNSETNECVSQEKCPKRPECPSGMTFNDCAPACLPTCENPAPTCPDACLPNCTCPAGFLFNEKNDSCVPKDECPKQDVVRCPSEMIFVSCNQACYATCESPEILCHNSSNCTSGACICNKELLLNTETDTCVSEDKCPRKPECPPGMVFDDCAPACLPTCENPQPFCNETCIANCTCKDGFVYNEMTLNCISNDSCITSRIKNKNLCSAGMSLRSCKALCYGTCENPTEICLKDPDCKETCACNDGLVLDTDSGTCIELKDCPRNCKNGMVFNKCATACPRTCDNPNPECNETCIPKCTCTNDLLFNEETRECVPKEECQMQMKSCPSGMVLKSCEEKCLNTCESQNEACRQSDCNDRFCGCLDELVLEIFSNSCLKKEQCPKGDVHK